MAAQRAGLTARFARIASSLPPRVILIAVLTFTGTLAWLPGLLAGEPQKSSSPTPSYARWRGGYHPRAARPERKQTYIKLYKKQCDQGGQCTPECKELYSKIEDHSRVTLQCP
jgi:hypothetical protein